MCQGALNEMTQCLKLRPGDSEAQALAAAWKGHPDPEPREFAANV